MLKAAIAPHAGREGGLLPALHAVQEAFGYLPPETARIAAEAFNLSRADVHGVITFYHDFRTNPPGRHVVRICRAEACQSMGARALEGEARRILGLACGETRHDGAVSLEPVFCLGHCAAAPAVEIDGEPHGRVDGAKLGALLRGLA